MERLEYSEKLVNTADRGQDVDGDRNEEWVPPLSSVGIGGQFGLGIVYGRRFWQDFVSGDDFLSHRFI